MIIFNIKYKMKDQFIYYISTDTNKECIYDKFNYTTYHPNIQLGGWGNDGRILFLSTRLCLLCPQKNIKKQYKD